MVSSGSESISLTTLSRTKAEAALRETMVDIYEYQPLRVQVTGLEAEIRFPSPAGEAICYSFTYKDPYSRIYPSDNLPAYPWSIGHFIYEVEISGSIYYGAANVLPHRLSKEQFAQIANLIESELPGLTVNHQQEMERIGTPVLDTSDRALLKWLENAYSPLSFALDEMEKEQDASLSRHYRIEQTPKRIDRRSLEWKHSPKGMKHPNKFYNRKHQVDVNTPENQYVKHQLKQLLSHIDRLILNLFQEKDRMDSLCHGYARDIEEIGSSEGNPLLRNHLFGKKESLRSLEGKRSRVIYEIEQVQPYKERLESRLGRPYWRQVDACHPRVPVRLIGRGYRSFLMIWKDGPAQLESGAGRLDRSWPVLHPTSKLYEYYVLLKMVEPFVSRGYHVKDDSLVRQLRDGYLHAEFHAGTTIVLENDGREIHLVYDEEVEYRSKEAISNETYFFSKFGKRRPDIRIDHYEKVRNELHYRSSVVMEVKYSPLRNIYAPNGNTKAADQMNEYIGIKYYCPYRRDYFSRIREVICLYPGDHTEAVKLNTEAGKFIQFYPTVDEVVGLKEVDTVIDEWLLET
ncbi:DUF2357 domain-containing protein [Halobacillus litoralis]|uniref:DUF2357 domain-containing protein n=1 Tax=Halobacillus litoralis TaxID=45668 RepID=UPI001CD71EFC|nr:DUF2357 domain-containing protein [Halobacillus litoralis]MCA0970768.1 DUF2357 domain-containing protein [Halobacillus litoralis]